jgi:hypothetical protein
LRCFGRVGGEQRAKLTAEGFNFLPKMIDFFESGSGGLGADVIGGGFRRGDKFLCGFGWGGNWRDFGQSRGVGSACGGRLGRKFHTPEVGHIFREIQFDVAVHRAEGAFAENLADNFAFGLLIGEENQLAKSDSGGQANDGSVFEDQHGGCFFGEEIALAGNVGRTSASGDDGDFESDRIRARRW